MFVVFTDCENCTRPISTNPGSMEAGEYGLTRGTCFFTSHLEVVAVTGCCGFLGVFWAGRDSFSRPYIQGSQRRLGERATAAGHFAHRELADPHQVYHFLCSHLRIMASLDQCGLLPSPSSPVQAGLIFDQTNPASLIFPSTSRHCS